MSGKAPLTQLNEWRKEGDTSFQAQTSSENAQKSKIIIEREKNSLGKWNIKVELVGLDYEVDKKNLKLVTDLKLNLEDYQKSVQSQIDRYYFF